MTLRLEPFTRSELQRIHAATVRVIEHSGIRVPDPDAARALRAAGASYDPTAQVVRIPEDVLRELLLMAPSRFHLHGRSEDYILDFGEGNTYFSSLGTAAQVDDGKNGPRPATLKDVENLYRLVDGSLHLDHASSVVWPQDVPSAVAHLYQILYGFKHTTKSLDGYCWGRQASQDVVDMAAIVAGGADELEQRPLLLGFAKPVSPLTLAQEATEGLTVFARAGQPCIIPPQGAAGGTVPSTLAGVLVQQNAEVLAGIALAQSVRRGAPVLYGSVSSPIDLRAGTASLGAPEAGLVSLGAAQLARYYGLPSRGTGGTTEAFHLDYQAGAESAATLLLSALAGFDVIYDASEGPDSGATTTYAKLMLDDDLVGSVKRIASGVDISEETLATAAVDAVRHKGAYLARPHMMDVFLQEHFLPETFLPAGRPSAPAAALLERANARADRILKEHRVDPPLAPSVEAKLRAFLKKAMKRPSVAAPAATSTRLGTEALSTP